MLLVYTAKNLTSFGSYELNIKTQITSVFGKKFKFKDSVPLNNFFPGSITNIKLEYDLNMAGLKWDHFLTAHLTLIYTSNQSRILWDFSVSFNGSLEKISPQKSVTFEY